MNMYLCLHIWLQSIEVSDSDIPSTVGYVPQVVSVIDAQPEGGIIPRFTLYTIKSVCVKNEGSSLSILCLGYHILSFL